MSRDDVSIFSKWLKKVSGKFERTMGVRAWGLDATNVPRVLLVDPDGTLHVNIVAIVPAAVDVTDRAARLLGIVYGDVGQLLQRPVTRDLLVQLRSAGVEIDPRARTWTLGALDVPDVSDRWIRQLGMIDLQRYLGIACGPLNPIDVSAVIVGVVDVSDRWARQLGQIDLARVLGVALSAANPVIAGIFDALGNRMPSMDVAARPGFVDSIDRWARQLGLIDVSRVLGAVLSAANPVIAGIFDAAGNRMPSMDVAARPGFVDVIDRAARLLGIIYGDVGQVHQVAPADALAPGTALSVAGFNFVFNGVTWDMVREGSVAGSVLTDPVDRWARQLGLIDISRVLGAALTAANPVIMGLYGVSGDRLPVFPHDLSIPISPAKIVVQSFENLVGSAAEGAAINLALNTNHRGAGANSVEFDKAAGNILAGVSYTIAALDLSLYSTHAQIAFYIYLPTPVGGNVVQVYAALGTDNANLFYWAIPIADLTLDAWNHVMLSMMDVSGVLGVGANLGAVTWAAIYVQTNVVGATMTNILVDQLDVKRTFEVNIMQGLPTLYDGLTPTHLVRAGTFQYVYDAIAGDWNRLREGSTIGSQSVDITDRWARQLGLIDISRVLGVALSAVNPVIAGIYDAAGNRMPSMDVAARPGFQDVIDRAARLLGIVYGESAQLQQLTPADALVPNLSLEASGFPHVYDALAGDWNRWIQSTTQGVPLVEDTGKNTNPRRYEKDQGFVSSVVTVAGGPAQVAIWAVGVLCIRNPSGVAANGRTNTHKSTVYSFHIENRSGAQAFVWLETLAAVALTPAHPLADNQSLTLDWDAGLTLGDVDVYLNATVAGVVGQISGTEAA